MTTLSQETLNVARDLLGIKEATGKNDGPFVKFLQHWMARGEEWMDGQPYCAAGFSFCKFIAADRLGVTPRMPRFSASTDIAAWLKRAGLLAAVPQVGYICLLRGDGGSPGKTHHHTCLVETVDETTQIVTTLDFNWGNQITRTEHPISECDFGPVV